MWHSCDVTQELNLATEPPLQPDKDQLDWSGEKGPGLCSRGFPDVYSRMEGRPIFFLTQLKRHWETHVSGTLLLSKAWNVVQSVFMNIFKQKTVPLVETSASLTSNKHLELCEYWACMLWEIHLIHSILCKHNTFHPARESVQGQSGGPFVCSILCLTGERRMLDLLMKVQAYWDSKKTLNNHV